MSGKALILAGLVFIIVLFLAGLVLAFLPSSALGRLQRRFSPEERERGPGDDPA